MVSWGQPSVRMTYAYPPHLESLMTRQRVFEEAIDLDSHGCYGRPGPQLALGRSKRIPERLQ